MVYPPDDLCGSLSDLRADLMILDVVAEVGKAES